MLLFLIALAVARTAGLVWMHAPWWGWALFVAIVIVSCALWDEYDERQTRLSHARASMARHREVEEDRWGDQGGMPS